MTLQLALTAMLALAVGTALGFLHFRALYMVTQQFVDGRTGAAIGWQLAIGFLVITGFAAALEPPPDLTALSWQAWAAPGIIVASKPGHWTTESFTRSAPSRYAKRSSEPWVVMASPASSAWSACTRPATT